MRTWREETLRNGADDATIACLDLWHSLCNKLFQARVEVRVASRREFPPTAQATGELNTAVPICHEGKVILLLLFDDTSCVEEVIVTHELGHWVLKLQGYRGLINHDGRFSNEEIFLTSLAHHSPLYELQLSLGHDPQLEIDKRAAHNLQLFGKSPEDQVDRRNRKLNALMLGDDFLHCSQDYIDQLRTTLARNHPNTLSHVDTILDTVTHYDCLSPTGNADCFIRVVQNLSLGGRWEPVDESKAIRELVEKSSS